MSRTIRVVAAVFTRDGRVLACRRSPERSAGGQWEFPGGKIEDGETPPQALRREIREELDVLITVGELLDRTVTRVGQESIDLAGYRVDTDDEPISSTDHDQLRWLRPDDLLELDWAEPDLPIVQILTSSSRSEAGPDSH